MTAIFIVLLITLAIYSAFGMVFYGSYAPPFLAVALICLFVALKKTWAEMHTVHELLKKENDKDKEETDSESTDESVK